MINAQLDDLNCKILLKGIENKSKDLSKAMKTIAVDLRTSIEENFEVGGRYSSPGAIIGGSKKWTIKNGRGSLLGSSPGSSALHLSFVTKFDKDSATVGTNKKYARIHNFGGKTKPHEINARNFKSLKFNWKGDTVHYSRVHHPGSNIPARPFMVVQPEDIEGFKETLLEHLTEGTK